MVLALEELECVKPPVMVVLLVRRAVWIVSCAVAEVVYAVLSLFTKSPDV